jgi:hypothetical protein
MQKHEVSLIFNVEDRYVFIERCSFKPKKDITSSYQPYEHSHDTESPCNKCTGKRQSYPCNRPWRPIGLQDVKAPTFSRQLAHRRWRGGQPYAPVTLYPQEDSWYSFLLEAIDPRAIMRLEGLGQLKNLMTLSGIETANFPLVA